MPTTNIYKFLNEKGSSFLKVETSFLESLGFQKQQYQKFVFSKNHVLLFFDLLTFFRMTF